MRVFSFAFATTMATFALLVVGGTVNPTGSSLACPDWPTCYGSFFPEMKNGVEFEHTHRVVATIVGFMTLVLAAWIWKARPTDLVSRALGFVAAFLVVVQGLLGGMTVLLRLPLSISTLHFALSMFFFSFLIYLTYRLWPGHAPRSIPRVDTTQAARRMAAVGAAAVYGQMLLGAFVRHTNSGGACGDEFPWCGGEIWPAWGPSQLHMLHRYAGYTVFLLIMVLAVLIARSARANDRPVARRLALAAPYVAAIQVLLGVLTVITAIGIVEVAAHLAGGALLLANFVLLYLALGPVPVTVPRPRDEKKPVGALVEATGE